jgi:hypothetical protein
LPISSSNPKNLLILTDFYNPDALAYEYNYEGKIKLWDIPESNQFYGDFQNGSARELNIKPSVFIHASGVIDPAYLQKQVSWLNNAFGLNNSMNNYYAILFRVLTTLVLFVLLSITGTYLGSKFLSFLPNVILMLSLFILTIFFTISLIRIEQLWITFLLTTSIVSIIISITKNDNFWNVKKQYTDCNYVVKPKFITRKQEIMIKVGIFTTVAIELLIFLYLLTNPNFMNYWILFILYILFILPYQLQSYLKKLMFSSKDRNAYREIDQKS